MLLLRWISKAIQAVHQPNFRFKRKCSLLLATAWAINPGGHEAVQALGSDRLACFLAKNAHEPSQELLHQPESAIRLVLAGQNRSLLWPCALSWSLGRWWTGCGQLFPESGILLRKPIYLRL